MKTTDYFSRKVGERKERETERDREGERGEIGCQIFGCLVALSLVFPNHKFYKYSLLIWFNKLIQNHSKDV